MKWYEFVIKFNLNVFFIIYYGLVNVILKDWKVIFINFILNVIYVNIIVNSLRISFIYFFFLNIVFVFFIVEIKILCYRFIKIIIKNVYFMLFKVINEVKIIMF